MSRSDDGNQRTIITPAHLFRKKKKKTKPSQSDVIIPNRPLGLAWILFFLKSGFCLAFNE